MKARPLITIRKPSGKRRGFRLLKNWKVVENPQIDAINKAVEAGSLTLDRAEQMAREVLVSYRNNELASLPPNCLPENEKAAEK